jgi:RND superfamily putative drug exporter
MAGARLIRPGLPAAVPGLRTVVQRLGDVPPPVGAFSRLAAWVQRRPWLVALGVLALLVASALPALSMQLRSSGTELLPVGAEQRSFFEELDERFPGASRAEITIITRGLARAGDGATPARSPRSKA